MEVSQAVRFPTAGRRAVLYSPSSSSTPSEIITSFPYAFERTYSAFKRPSELKVVGMLPLNELLDRSLHGVAWCGEAQHSNARHSNSLCQSR